MQAELAYKLGEIVIEAVRADGGVGKIREFDIISPYLSTHNIKVIDLLESFAVRDLRSLGLPKDLRSAVGKRVKFVEPGIRPGKIGWDLGDEVWFNVTNPTVRKIYERIRGADMSDKEQLALSILISLMIMNLTLQYRSALKS